MDPGCSEAAGLLLGFSSLKAADTLLLGCLEAVEVLLVVGCSGAADMLLELCCLEVDDTPLELVCLEAVDTLLELGCLEAAEVLLEAGCSGAVDMLLELCCSDAVDCRLPNVMTLEPRDPLILVAGVLAGCRLDEELLEGGLTCMLLPLKLENETLGLFIGLTHKLVLLGRDNGAMAGGITNVSMVLVLEVSA